MRVITRKKGNKSYYYLQHSFRENGEVITRELYLGQKIPKNIEHIKKNLIKEMNIHLYKKLETIRNHFQEEWKTLPASAKEHELKEIAIAFTYNTNAIEGSTITLEETRSIIKDKIAPHKPLRDIKETENHYHVFLQMLENKEKASNTLLLRWHKEIFSSTKPDIAGKFRNYLVSVGGYLAPDWQDVRNLMDDLIKFINREKINPAELAGRAHYIFETIHPFGDGNGRIGRLLMNYILWHAGYPMLIIEYHKRTSYYKAFHRGEEGFLRYFLRRYLAVHKRRIFS